MSLFGDAPPRRLTLIKLSGEIARSVAGVGKVAVEGEVYRARRLPNGRGFFTLRDRAAQISVTYPPAKSRQCRTVDGERACVTGQLQYANDRGQLNLVADEVVPVGAGAVAAMIAEARERLRADGLLDRPRRPLPRLPECIAVICGSEAAVRGDIESVVAVRFPGYRVEFTEVPLSGSGAADGIASVLTELDARPDVQVIVLARGGGDATQLLPFSDEYLCRAVAGARAAIVSAIGHEGDRPLCDEVADFRYGTPSLAAQAVVPSKVELRAELDRLLGEATATSQVRLEDARQRLGAIDPAAAVTSGIGIVVQRLHRLGDQLELLHPGRRAEEARARLARIDWRAPLPRRATHARDQLAAQRRHLEALSPVRVLERGYAVVRRADGTVVRVAAQVDAGDGISVQLAVGRLTAQVTATAND